MEKIRTKLLQSGHPILEVSIPILLQVKSIVIDVERSLKGDRQAAPPNWDMCVPIFFVMRELPSQQRYYGPTRQAIRISLSHFQGSGQELVNYLPDLLLSRLHRSIHTVFGSVEDSRYT